MSDAGISAVRLPQFNSLSLSLCGTLTDKSLLTIPANLPRLKFLSLGYNNPNSFFTDAGLYPAFFEERNKSREEDKQTNKNRRRAGRPTETSLIWTRTALRELRHLAELRLERSWGHLSGDGVRALRLANPNLLVRNW